MNTIFSRALGLGLASLLIGGAPGAVAHAQSAFGTFREPPSAALTRHLRTLVANPRNLDALRGAGRAALDVGDLDAAVGFFARAEEVSPRDGRTKAGLGSVFTMLRQPSAALRFFQDAVSLGVPALEIARDRGLAYDLRGNTRLAQADYRLVLASRPDPEVTRRLALSQAIAGDQKGALATLDPQVRAKDPAGWRVRAFVLAIGGDAAGATRAAQAVMPAAQASTFAPYFRRMASLRASEKAAAAHFGSFPGDPGAIRMADLMSEGERAARVALESVGRAPTAGLDAGRPDAGQVALGREEGQVPASTAGSRVALAARPAPATVTARNPVPTARTATARPGFSSDLIRIVGTRADPSPTPATTGSAPVRVTAATPAPAPAPTPAPVLNVTPASTTTNAAPASSSLAPVQTGSATASTAGQASPSVSPSSSLPVQGPPVPTDLASPTTTSPVTSGPLPTGAAQSTPTAARTVQSVVAQSDAPPPPQPKVEPVATAAASSPPPSRPKVERLAQASPPPPRPKVETSARAAPVAAAPKVEDATRTGPSTAARHYAQVGIGQDVSALAGDWRRLRARAGGVLTGQNAWTAKLNRTNRLLVGPFANARDAQAFVNKLTAAKVDAYVFSSAPEDEVVALGR